MTRSQTSRSLLNTRGARVSRRASRANTSSIKSKSMLAPASIPCTPPKSSPVSPHKYLNFSASEVLQDRGGQALLDAYTANSLPVLSRAECLSDVAAERPGQARALLNLLAKHTITPGSHSGSHSLAHKLDAVQAALREDTGDDTLVVTREESWLKQHWSPHMVRLVLDENNSKGYTHLIVSFWKHELPPDMIYKLPMGSYEPMYVFTATLVGPNGVSSTILGPLDFQLPAVRDASRLPLNRRYLTYDPTCDSDDWRNRVYYLMSRDLGLAMNQILS